jgi:hypothetical protein
MSAFSYQEDLTDEQSKTLEKAAFLVVNARTEAVSMLTEAGIEPVPEPGWFGSPCGATLPPPPSNHRCGCRDYKGNGGACSSQFTDFTGPDLGDGSPTRTCGHLPSQHLET